MTNIYVCEASYDKAYGVIFPYILMQVSPSSTFVSGPWLQKNIGNMGAMELIKDKKVTTTWERNRVK